MTTAQSDAEEEQNDDQEELEATELHDYEDGAHSRSTSSAMTAADGDTNRSNVELHTRQRKSPADMIKAFWKRHIAVTVSHEACRDHLGTFYVCKQ